MSETTQSPDSGHQSQIPDLQAPIVDPQPRKTRRRTKPASERQIAANRANAARSTGPTSPNGLARSSRNSLKHGLATSKFTVVRLEDIDEIARLRADMVACYRPVNSQELMALERMAIAQQQILRAARLESGMFTSCMNESFGPDGAPRLPLEDDLTRDIEVTVALNRNFLLADGFQILARKGDSFQLLLRYQAQVERLYRRAVEEYERLKKLRPELPNEPITSADLAPEPQENTTDSPSPELSPNEPISGAGASARRKRLPHLIPPCHTAPGGPPRGGVPRW